MDSGALISLVGDNWPGALLLCGRAHGYPFAPCPRCSACLTKRDTPPPPPGRGRAPERSVILETAPFPPLLFLGQSTTINTLGVGWQALFLDVPYSHTVGGVGVGVGA